MMAVTLTALLVLAGLSAFDARPDGRAQAFAGGEGCYSGGVWVPGGIEIGGECKPGGGGENPGPPPGPRQGWYTETKWTECGESSWPSPRNPPDICTAVRCTEEGSSDGSDRPWLFWTRQVLYKDGKIVEEKPWTSTGGSRCKDPDEPNPTPDPEAVKFKLKELLPKPAPAHSPEGTTLVAFDTILYTEAGKFEQQATVDGFAVVIGAEPVGFKWNTGDNGSEESTTPGRKLHKDVTHEYDKVGTFNMDVDITWKGYFTFNGQRQEIPGELTVADGPSVPVTTAEVLPRLSGK